MMGPIGCPKTTLRNYHHSLLNNPEGRSSHTACLLQRPVAYSC